MSQTKAQLLDPKGDVTYSGHITGVGATFNGNIRAVDGVFSGNVSIAGTLTKQDVTNVDAVGLITARSGINVTGGNVFIGQGGSGANNAELKLQAGAGTGNDIIAFLNQAGATKGNLTYDTDNNFLLFNVNSNERFRIKSDGAVNLTTANASLEWTASSGSNPFIRSIGSGQQQLEFNTGGNERLRIGTGGGNNSIGINTTNNMVTNSEVLAVYGTSSFKSQTEGRPALYLGNEGAVDDTANPMVLFNQGGTNRGGIGYVPNTGELRFNNQYFHTFTTGASSLGGTERLRIHADGEVEIKGGAAGQNALLVSANYAGGANVDIQTWQRIGGAVKAKMIYKDASTDMRLGTDTAHSFSLMTGGTDRLTINSSGTATFTGAVLDYKGNVRSVPLNTQASTYTLIATDAGKAILASNTISISDGVFGAGDVVTIINNTNGDIAINKGSVLYNTADGTNGNRTLATRGIATIYFTHNTTGYISGTGLS